MHGIVARNLLKNSFKPFLLEPYIAARLIPLNKNPGIRPIGIGESLRRLIGKTITPNISTVKSRKRQAHYKRVQAMELGQKLQFME